jgi:uncharacterized protein YjiS (DUF1127 family)
MLGSLKERLARHRRYTRTIKELTFLSDRELADLGIHRADIRRIAREAAV